MRYKKKYINLHICKFLNSKYSCIFSMQSIEVTTNAGSLYFPKTIYNVNAHY